MSTILQFTVPGAPVPAARARVVKGHAFTPAKTATFEQRVGLYTMRAMAAAGWPRDANAHDLGKGPFGLRLDFYREKDVGDFDNLSKSVADGMSKARIWANDKYVHEAHARLFTDRERPRVEISVWRL